MEDEKEAKKKQHLGGESVLKEEEERQLRAGAINGGKKNKES